MCVRVEMIQRERETELEWRDVGDGRNMASLPLGDEDVGVKDAILNAAAADDLTAKAKLRRVEIGVLVLVDSQRHLIGCIGVRA